MLDVYRQTANLAATEDARALAHDLAEWHNVMVRHSRQVTALGFSAHACALADDCAHATARELWLRAVEAFGRHAWDLAFLRTSAGVPAAAEA